MDLMSNMGEYQTKESPGRMISEHYTTMSPEKHDSSGEEGMNSLPEGEWALLNPKEGWHREWEGWLQDERNRKRKYKYIIWCNLIHKKVFLFSSKGL